jgi:hypothetical protein
MKISIKVAESVDSTQDVVKEFAMKVMKQALRISQSMGYVPGGYNLGVL